MATYKCTVTFGSDHSVTTQWYDTSTSPPRPLADPLNLPLTGNQQRIPFNLVNDSGLKSVAFPSTSGTTVGKETVFPLTVAPTGNFLYGTEAPPSSFTLDDNDQTAQTFQFQVNVIANGAVYSSTDPAIINKNP